MKLYKTTVLVLTLMTSFAAWSLAQDAKNTPTTGTTSAPTPDSQSAQFAIGSIIKQFELPQRDNNGKMQSTIYGKEATVMSQNRIRVRDLKIDIFNGDSVGTKLISPESDFWSEEKRLTTSNGVTVVQPEFTLTSVNMDWDIKNSKGVFSKRVRVVITQKGDVLGGGTAATSGTSATSPDKQKNSEKANK
jgi:hypothetical protein